MSILIQELWPRLVFSVQNYKEFIHLRLSIAPCSYIVNISGLAALDGYIYAVGGWESAHRLDTVERYDPKANTWSFMRKLKIAVTSAAVVAHNKMLYVAGTVMFC